MNLTPTKLRRLFDGTECWVCGCDDCLCGEGD